MMGISLWPRVYFILNVHRRDQNLPGYHQIAPSPDKWAYDLESHDVSAVYQ